jgi:hypothetical protein
MIKKGTDLVVSEREPSSAERKRVLDLSGRFAHLGETVVDREAVLERVEIECVDAVPAVDAQQVGIGFELDDVAIEHCLVHALARDKVHYRDFVPFLALF